MSNSVLEDSSGNKSSKRIAGFILVAGVLIIAGIAIWKDPSQAANILWPLVSLAAVCFGATAVEKLKP